LWFVKALKKSGVSAENLLIKTTNRNAPAKAAKKATKKTAGKKTIRG
jgi:hypothetical protein